MDGRVRALGSEEVVVAGNLRNSGGWPARRPWGRIGSHGASGRMRRVLDLRGAGVAVDDGREEAGRNGGWARRGARTLGRWLGIGVGGGRVG